MTEQPRIIVITGIMASGKSTVAQHLAERFERGVHLRGDMFRRMIVKGRLEMQPEFSEPAFEQLRLRYRLAAMTARGYADAGFTVIYQDVILGALLNEVVAMLKGVESTIPLHVVALCPSVEAVAERDRTRHKVAYGSWSPAQLDYIFRTETPHIGLWLDTSLLTVSETVDSVLLQLPDANV
jgi:chloramphenicol 3-O-phosphotransferase